MPFNINLKTGSLRISPEEYLGFWNLRASGQGDYNNGQASNFIVVKGVKYKVVVGSGTFEIILGDNGVVSVLNNVSATSRSLGELSFNTYEVSIVPESNTVEYAINSGVLDLRQGATTLSLVPSINYKMNARLGNTSFESKTFLLSSPCSLS